MRQTTVAAGAGRLRRALVWPYAAAVGVPLAILALAGWLNHRRIEAESFRGTARTTQAITEHSAPRRRESTRSS
jgi:hypothetical protein